MNYFCFMFNDILNLGIAIDSKTIASYVPEGIEYYVYQKEENPEDIISKCKPTGIGLNTHYEIDNFPARP